MEVDHASGGAPALKSLNDLTDNDSREELLSVISQLTEIEATTFDPLKTSLKAWAITPAVLRAIRADRAAAQTLIDNLETDVGDKKWWLAVQTLLKRFLFDDGAYREMLFPAVHVRE
jgi:hypothetical protein